MNTEMPSTIHLKDYRPSDYLIDHVDLDFILTPAATKVCSHLTVRHNPIVEVPSDTLHLQGENLKLEKVKLDGKILNQASYNITSTELIISNVPTHNFELEITTIINPQANTALTGLYLSKDVYCTQCEAEGFRRITYFLDRPDILATYTTRIEASRDEATTLLSNGNLVESGHSDDGKNRYAIWNDPYPKPSYLFALVAGNLSCVKDAFTTASGKKVNLSIYVEPGKADRCDWAMNSLKRAMRWDEQSFGREYDLNVFNIVAISDFNMGAMENKGLNIFNDQLILASPDTATDKHYLQIESVVAHEYFHNWTGNRITCRDWFQLCLKEGLTVFRDQEFIADQRDRTVERIESVRNLRARQFPEDASPLAHPVRPSSYIEINNFYTATIYEKGAELVRMIQIIAGREGFRAGMDLYFKLHDGEAVTIEDFLKCFNNSVNVELKQFFTWYTQAGTPKLICNLKYDDTAKSAELFVKQITDPTPNEDCKKALHIPLRLGLLDRDGSDFALVLSDNKHIIDGVVHVTQYDQKFEFKNITTHPVPSYLRGFSAPVKLIAEQSDQNLAFLMANDADLFSRWQATCDYAMRVAVQMIDIYDADTFKKRVKSYSLALEKSISNEALGHAYRAELLKFPTETDIAREINHNIDTDIVLKVHKLFAKTVSTVIGSTLEKLYYETDISKVFSPDAEQSGRRALRNACLYLLASRGYARDKQRLITHYENATNMTDKAHSLKMLTIFGVKENRDKALDSFYELWKDDHLVIDIWFAVQATVPAKITLSHVKRLMRCNQFSLVNPNKVRALIGNFAMQNPSQFNRLDGKGYTFVGQKILELDRINPQIAARLLNAFSSWQTLEPIRRQKAELTLNEMFKSRDLSRDVYEILTKILEG
ncbi:MAG: Aminopeptidase N [Hyphomicrobiaceae bacterium hypho_1]